ncbi:hypothetical protein F4818DRAFT_436274 [Hypoxylon cercidicola]|nr:hypothetical protein F4818DRAFT_436274 [Hypoxylon cercidicola]
MSSITTGSELSSIASSTMPTLSLPPQITPFTPPPTADCTPSVYCPYLSYILYSTSKDLSGMACAILFKLGEGEIGYRTECFPKGYFTLFNYESLLDIESATAEPPESSAVAYPGTACMSGWTTACTSVVTYDGRTYPQAWCCPSSSWRCAATAGRFCTSIMTEATNIWMTWDPAFTYMSGDYYTWTAEIDSEPSESAATVYRRVFPVQLPADSSGAPTPDNNSQYDSPVNNSSDDDNSRSALSTGAIAGIGTAAGIVILAVFMFWILHRRRRKSKKSSGEETVSEDNPPPAPTEQASGDKAELEGTTVTQAKGVIPKAELDAGNGEGARPEQDGSVVGFGSQRGTVSPLGTLSPDPTGSDGIFPSPESRHKSVFEMSG